jgi:type II secretory pathway predicted ATPase ExeA
MPTAAKFANHKEVRYMPLNLKGVLADAAITQAEWADAIKQKRGKPLSLSAATLILNQNVWPRETAREDIKSQTERFLRLRGVDAELIKLAWREDTFDRFRHAHPRGVHARHREFLNPAADLAKVEVEMLTARAKKHFHIFKDPFINDVQNADDVFLSAEQRYIREAMFTTAKHGGFLAVVGESGSGKTTLRRDLIDRIERESHPIAVVQPRVIDKTRLTAGMICEAIIRDLSTQRPRQTLEAKARQVEEILRGSSRAGNAHVLIIEEAHDMTVPTLKYLKRFWELEDGFKKLLAIIIIGQPELKAKLDERQNYEAREVIRRCEIAELQPLNGNLEDYVALKFKRIGMKTTQILARDSYDAIHTRLTIKRRGSDDLISLVYPLIVNNLVVKAMNLAAEVGAPKVSSEIIQEI